MSIASLIRSMTEAGATPEAIALAVEAIEAIGAKDEERRAKQRERTKKSRAKSRDSNVTVTDVSRDKAELGLPPSSPLPSPQTPKPSPLYPPSTPSEAGASAEVVPFPETKPSKADKQIRMPANFTLTPERQAFARKEGLSDAEAVREFAKFAGYHGAKGTRFVNWDRAWENWVRNAVDRFAPSRRASSGGYGPQAGGRLGAMQRAVARFADQDALPE